MITVVREGFDKREAAGWIAGEAKKKIGADDPKEGLAMKEIIPALDEIGLLKKVGDEGRRGALGTPGHSSTPKT